MTGPMKLGDDWGAAIDAAYKELERAMKEGLI